MSLIEIIRAAGAGGITYDELVAKLEGEQGRRAGLAYELQQLIAENQVEREGGTYWARAPRRAAESNTPKGTVPVVKAPPTGGKPLGKPASDRPAVPMSPAPPSGEPAAGAARREASMANTKRCPRCEKTKPLEEFYGNGYCKPCGRARQAERDARRRGEQPESKPRKPKPPASSPRPTPAAAAPSPEPGPLQARIGPRLLLPAQAQIAIALEQRENHQVVQLASDAQTIIEISPSQMDAIVEWWRGARAA